MISGLGCIYREMEDGHNRQLPAPSKAQIKGYGVQNAVYKEMVPIATLGFGDILRLEQKVADQMTDE